jgi:hypothetical protein
LTSRWPITSPTPSSPGISATKDVPGHHIQVDVKFVFLRGPEGKRVRRFQYTAIDDATRIRAMQIYTRHNQQNAIKFIDYVIEKFPFRLHTIRTDRGHEFQAQFHWHVEDKGIRHVYIKPRSPQLNGKVERSHRTDQEEFYQSKNTLSSEGNSGGRHWIRTRDPRLIRLTLRGGRGVTHPGCSSWCTNVLCVVQTAVWISASQSVLVWYTICI